MKNLLKYSLVALSLTVAANAAEKIVVGATPVPHAEILDVAKPILAKDGITLEIKEFNKNKGTHLVKTVGVNLEPMGVYSKKIKDIKELKDGSTVAIPNDPTNESRALDVLATAGLIKLNDNPLKTPLDITQNPKKLKFEEIESAQVPRTLDDVTIAVINTNYALNANLNPTKDALVLESKDSPYTNYIVVKAGNENSPKIKALDKAVTSPEVKKFIEEKYKGAIIPSF